MIPILYIMYCIDSAKCEGFCLVVIALKIWYANFWKWSISTIWNNENCVIVLYVIISCWSFVLMSTSSITMLNVLCRCLEWQWTVLKKVFVWIEWSVKNYENVVHIIIVYIPSTVLYSIINYVTWVICIRNIGIQTWMCDCSIRVTAVLKYFKSASIHVTTTDFWYAHNKIIQRDIVRMISSTVIMFGLIEQSQGKSQN